MPIITLVCFVRGNPPAFAVNISNDKRIRHLKHAIVGKLDLPYRVKENVYPQDLKLWLVNIPLYCKEKLMSLALQDHDELPAKEKISTYFPNSPTASYIHVFVKLSRKRRDSIIG